MQTIMKDVPVKARKKIPYTDKYEEYPTRVWTSLAKEIGKHLAAGGHVELDHRRLNPPVQGAYGSKIGGTRPAPYDIVEVCDVKFL